MGASIGDRIKIARVNAGLTQSELAEKCGWPGGQRRSSHYESNRSTPSYSDMVKIGRVLGVSAAYLAFGESQLGTRAPSDDAMSEVESAGEMLETNDVSSYRASELVEVPVLSEFEIQENLGNVNSSSHFNEKMRFTRSTFRRAGVDPEKAACMQVTGNSMEPVLPDGTIVGVDLSESLIKDGKLYAIVHGGLLRVKLLYRLPEGAVRLRSYNFHEWPDEKIESSQQSSFQILGRVFWYSVYLE